jgi:hypothetical protein
MIEKTELHCDGCGQIASAEHVARRLRRLEWATRYRPVHISTLFLGAFSPWDDREYLYCPSEEFAGEAALLLKAFRIETAGKSADSIQTEFQRAGYFLTHILECPLENAPGARTGIHPDSDWRHKAAATTTTELLLGRLPTLASRIRRSLKPRRVILITEAVRPVVENILALDLGYPVILNNGGPFEFSSLGGESELLQLWGKVAGASTG